MSLEFYKCAKCGDVVVKVYGEDSETAGSMTKLVPGEVDAALEKHVPVVTVNGSIIHVEVGSVLHPMLEEHSITTVVLENEHSFVVKQLNPGDEPKVDFVVDPDDKPVAVYEYCNLHGLWKAEV